MRRFAIITLVGVTCLGHGGCIGPLATMLARGPEAVAKNMGQQVGYNAAGSLAGSQLGTDVASAADTVAGIDQILEDHPDAVNAGELEKLRTELAEDLPPPDAEPVEGGEAMPGNDELAMGQSAAELARRRPAAHDRRRVAPGDTARSDHQQIGEDYRVPGESSPVHNNLHIEGPTTPDQRWRPQDPHRFSVPRSTSFSERRPPPPVHSLTGGGYVPVGIDAITYP